MDTFLAEIEAFIAEHKLSESQFGIDALNDKNFVPQLRTGRDIRMGTAEKVRAHMAEYREQAA